MNQMKRMYMFCLLDGIQIICTVGSQYFTLFCKPLSTTEIWWQPLPTYAKLSPTCQTINQYSGSYFPSFSIVNNYYKNTWKYEPEYWFIVWKVGDSLAYVGSSCHHISVVDNGLQYLLKYPLITVHICWIQSNIMEHYF